MNLGLSEPVYDYFALRVVKVGDCINVKTCLALKETSFFLSPSHIQIENMFKVYMAVLVRHKTMRVMVSHSVTCVECPYMV